MSVAREYGAWNVLSRVRREGVEETSKKIEKQEMVSNSGYE
jgi:hypothetical protein